MKIRLFCALIISSLAASLTANFDSGNRPHGWLSGNEVEVCEDGVYINTNLGRVKMTVIEYDQENDRYLVECIRLIAEPYPAPISSDNE